ncbi:unnamed protein product [Mesocestoides corti]|uniref:Bms1-type G domain-containing protein n=1 Tax=Mesocestoides corti TaxID=53468 RepID=A0A158QW39_MESCO|nr:unnamed protein product [Mesocestoides corti]
MDNLDKKKHRAPKSGAKALKKTKNPAEVVSRNPKGAAVQHTVKAARKVRKTLDRETKKYHIQCVADAAAVDWSSPLIVGIVGPPKCGKSTLLRALIKHFGRQLVPVVTGPITVVVGKKFKMTFIECDCNINSMIDVAKVADIVLLVVSVHRGLEMYHFEFISMLQTHGMPRVIPVLNHLDQFKESSASRALRKKIKQRLWTDISAKIFLLSRFIPKKRVCEGKEVEGDYLPAEIQRLARLMVVKTPRPSDWRVGHPYMLVDRLEDVTNPQILNENAKADRVISLYGWIKGAPIETSSSNPIIHIPGLGDFPVAECTRQEDPCPTPAQLSQNLSSTEEATEIKLKKRLSEGERKLYAPMSSIGGVLFDRDATYIDLGGSHHLGGGRLSSGRRAVIGPGEQELAKARDLLSSTGLGLDERLEREHEVRILVDAPLLKSEHRRENAKASSSVSEDCFDCTEGKGLRMFEDTALLDPEDELTNSAIVEQLKINQSAEFDNRHQFLKNAFDTEEVTSNNPGASALTGEMFHISTVVETSAYDDVTLPQSHIDQFFPNWRLSASTVLIANRFATGEWNASEDAEQLLAADANAVRAMEKVKAQKLTKAAGSRIKYKPDKETAAGKEFHSGLLEDNENDSSEIEENEDEEELCDPTGGFEKSLLRPTKRQRILEKRRRHKELFDRLYNEAQQGSGPVNEPATAFYDRMTARKEAQQQLNREVLAKFPANVRETVEGAPPGSYIRLQISGVPYQFIENFDPRQPVIVGGVVKGEEARGFIQARFQAHRWLKGVLKSNDPITVSIGWRRYQTVGVFSREEHNFRKRYLKYSLAHEHCHVTFYGPVVPAKTGVIAFVNSTWREQTESYVSPKFRIAGVGTVTDCNESFQIMKKLKLVGYPSKIFSKTAFVRGMFNSELEVAKMIGSKVQTVSKVRGLIKSALTGTSCRPGDFRATFEAPIRKADIVFLRTFVPIELRPFYNPIPNLLLPKAGTAASGNQWRMLRTVGELRFEVGLKPEIKDDSKYKEPQRVPFVPAPLAVPTKLLTALPFADKPKLKRKQLRSLRHKNDEVHRALKDNIPAPVNVDGISGVPDPVGHSHERALLIQRLRQLHQAFQDKEKEKMIARTSQYKAKRAFETQLALARIKKRRKEFFARRGGRVGDGDRKD